jgi:hemerythrin-like domain-containing protein
MPKSVSEYLLLEHQELSQLLNRLSQELKSLPATPNAPQAFERVERSSRKISQTLHIHLEEEEQVLYPALEEHVEGIKTTLERMRHELDAGEAVERAFFDCLKRLGKAGASRDEVIRSGRSYIQWVRGHLLNEHGRLFPLVERRLDPDTQRLVRRAMEELSHETSARVAETVPQGEPS